MLIDIDIEQLKFFLHPNIETLKPFIERIKEGYITEYGEEYWEKIEQNILLLDDVVFIVLQYQKKNFLYQFFTELIESIYLSAKFWGNLRCSIKNKFYRNCFCVQ